MINEVTKQTAVYKHEGVKKQESSKTKEKAPANTGDAAAVLELGKSEQDKAATYSKPASAVTSLAASDQKSTKKTDKAESTSELNAEEINRLWAEANKATQNLRDMVEQLLKSQGKTFKDVLSGKAELIVDEKTRAAAELAVSEDGECGVKAVSNRIVAFAKAISNDNPEMYDKLMSAIDEGFAQAGKALGGELPDICKKTHEEIKRKMDEWKASKAESTDEKNSNIPTDGFGK